MSFGWLSRVAVTLGAMVLGLILVASTGSPAWASTTITLAADQLPATAVGFAATHGPTRCGLLGGAGHRDNDLWIFALEGADVGDVETISLTFVTGAGQTTVKLVDAGSKDNAGIVTGYADAAWILTKPGWTLTAAIAQITGTAGRLILAVTCPASANPATTPAGEPRIEPVPTMSEAPLATNDRAPISGWATNRTAPLRPGPSRQEAVGTPTTPAPIADAQNKPTTTSQDISGMLTLGATMVTAGGLLLVARHRGHRGRHRRHRPGGATPQTETLYMRYDYPSPDQLDDVRQPAVVVRRR